MYWMINIENKRPKNYLPISVIFKWPSVVLHECNGFAHKTRTTHGEPQICKWRISCVFSLCRSLYLLSCRLRIWANKIPMNHKAGLIFRKKLMTKAFVLWFCQSFWLMHLRSSIKSHTLFVRNDILIIILMVLCFFLLLLYCCEICRNSLPRLIASAATADSLVRSFFRNIGFLIYLLLLLFFVCYCKQMNVSDGFRLHKMHKRRLWNCDFSVDSLCSLLPKFVVSMIFAAASGLLLLFCVLSTQNYFQAISGEHEIPFFVCVVCVRFVRFILIMFLFFFLINFAFYISFNL